MLFLVNAWLQAIYFYNVANNLCIKYLQFFPQFFKFKILSFFEFCRKILLTFSCCSPNCLLLVFMFEFSHVHQISEISLQATFTPKFKLIRESKESSNSSCFHFLLTSYMLRIFWGSYIFHIWFWNFKISLCVCLYFACSRLKLREQFLIFSDFLEHLLVHLLVLC